jgi:hypothetical protein
MAKAKSRPRADAENRRLVRVNDGHLYLPIDADGNVPLDWQEAADTACIDFGTQLWRPNDLIACLTGRVEIV